MGLKNGEISPENIAIARVKMFDFYFNKMVLYISFILRKMRGKWSFFALLYGWCLQSVGCCYNALKINVKL